MNEIFENSRFPPKRVDVQLSYKMLRIRKEKLLIAKR